MANYNLEQVDEILGIYHRAGNLLFPKPHSDKLYSEDRKVKQSTYDKFGKVLDEARKFPEVFFNVDEEGTGRNIGSRRIENLLMMYEGATSLLENGIREPARV